MIKIKVKDSQNIIDLTIQYYGSMEGLPLMLEDNNLTADAIVEKGTELTIQEDKVFDKTILAILARDSITVATGKEPNSYSYIITEDEDTLVNENDEYIVFE